MLYHADIYIKQSKKKDVKETKIKSTCLKKDLKKKKFLFYA